MTTEQKEAAIFDAITKIPVEKWDANTRNGYTTILHHFFIRIQIDYPSQGLKMTIIETDGNGPEHPKNTITWYNGVGGESNYPMTELWKKLEHNFNDTESNKKQQAHNELVDNLYNQIKVHPVR